MDHEVVFYSSKICDWLGYSSRDHFGFTSRIFLRVTMELEGSKRLIFHAYIIHCHDPMGFAVGEAKEVVSLQMFGTVVERCCFNNFNIDFLWFFSFFCQTFHSYKEGRGEEWEKVKHEVNYEHCPF
jgi:hypothetical protein